jgi:hypothetical protein
MTGSAYWISGWPALVAQWHPTKNGTLVPDDVSYGSGRRVWWKCPEGADHEWRASPNNRSAGRTGCPFCAGRRASVTNNLARLRPDLARQWHPTKNGALTPEQVPAGSAKGVWWRCLVNPEHEWRASPHARRALEGTCPFCLARRVSSTNALATLAPEVAAEWHPTKNGALTPRDVVAGSGRVVWWRCRRHPQHEWRAALANRAVRGTRCPFCTGSRASPQHSLATAYPDVAREWHPARNGALTPESVTPRASRLAWWRCPRGHDWRARVVDRTRLHGARALCPECRRSRGAA